MTKLNKMFSEVIKNLLKLKVELTARKAQIFHKINNCPAINLKIVI